MSNVKENRPSHLGRAVGLLVATCVLLVAPAHAAAFGIKSFEAKFETRVGRPGVELAGSATLAGSHPYLAGATIDFDTEEREGGTFTAGDVKDVEIELPAGLIGNPQATPTCEPSKVATQECPADTQIGIGGALLYNFGQQHVPMYNVTPPKGVPAEFGFDVQGIVPILLTASIRPAEAGSTEGYGIDLHVDDISQALDIYAASLEFFGNPPGGSGTQPFVTLPTRCGEQMEIRARATSWQGGSATASTIVPDASGNPVTLEGCGQVPFEPRFSSGLDTTATDSPSGLTVGIETPQKADPQGIASANLRSTTVDLPSGVSIDPSAAEGRASCSTAQFDQYGEGPSTCPEASKIGSVEIRTSILPDPLTGGVYLARQTENPFGSLIALYLVAEADGVRVKLPGKVSEDALTGQLTASFEETPQLPFEELTLHFFDGPRAALATPVTCGTQPVAASLAPWSGNPAASLSGSLTVSSGTGGSSCPSSPSARPFGLGFEAGTVSPAAALHSPFDLRVARPDGTQELGTIDTTLPEGLLATLRGVTECGSAEAAAATCGPGSQVGSVVVGAGAGSDPFYVKEGRAYLTGPYEGAPLGLDFVVPAVAGPLNLGTVNVRAALFVDPETTQVTVRSDPLPKILDGIPLRLRSVAIGVERPGFTVNPTSCDPTAVTGQVTSTEGATANLSDRFQAAGCRGLAFSPRLTPKLLGGRGARRRLAHPRLQVALSSPEGQANLAGATLTLPKAFLLDQDHIRTVCTRVQFAAGSCPAASVYGRASVTTPLLGAPLEGPVYLRSSSNKLPDLVIDLRGQIGIVLDGRITGYKGGIRVSFGKIPDAAVSRFVLRLKGGPRGLLENSVDICVARPRATVALVGQNGATATERPGIAGRCGTRSSGKHTRIKH